DLARVETEVADDREELTALMGLWGSDATWRIASHLPELPSDDAEPEALEELAVSQRLDLAAARQRIRTLLLARGLTRAYRWLPWAALGVVSEREVDNGVWSVGPSVELPIPIFDQGQATLARQSAELEQRRNEHAALEVTVRSQVRRARTRMDQSRRLARRSGPPSCRSPRGSSSRPSSSTMRCSPASSSFSSPSATRSTQERRTSRPCATTGSHAPSWRAPSAATWSTPASSFIIMEDDTVWSRRDVLVS